MTDDRTNNPETMRESALFLAKLGFRVHPLHVPLFFTVDKDGKVRCDCRRVECWIKPDGSGGGKFYKSVGKHPRLNEWGKRATTDPDQVEEWFGKMFPGSNIGIVCGTLPDQQEGLVVIDVDPRSSGDETFKELEHKLGPLPETVQAISGSGGPHYYLRTTTAMGSSKLPPGIDVQAGMRGTYNQLVAPPSLYWNGRRYAWELSSDPTDGATIATLPEAWRLHILGDARKATRENGLGPDANSPILEGNEGRDGPGRKQTLIRRGRSMWANGGFSRDDIRAALATMNTRCVPPLEENDLTRVLEFITKVPPGRSKEFEDKLRENKQNAASAERSQPVSTSPARGDLVEVTPELLRQWRKQRQAAGGPPADPPPPPSPPPPDDGPIPEPSDEDDWNDSEPILYTDLANTERFLSEHGDNLRYTPEAGWFVFGGQRWSRDELRPVSLAMGTAARIAAAAEADEEDIKLVRKQASATAVNAIVSLAKSRLATSVTTFDRDPMLFNAENGTIELTTGTLREFRRDDFLSKRSPVVFDPNATAPLWDAFLTRVLPDPEVRAFMQRLAGYWLTGVVHEHVFPVLWGSGGNGKGRFLDMFAHVMGTYARTVSPEMLMEREREEHKTELAYLLGARFAVAQETKQSKKLDENKVKMLTGGDRVNARFMHKDFFEFEPTHKLALATNHKPVLAGTDEGIWRRFVLVPWTVTIPKSEMDPRLGDKLRAEASGVLRWCVEGCLSWQREGLSPPKAVLAVTEDFRKDSDLVGKFLEQRVVMLKDARVQSSALYSAFTAWCEASGERPVRPKAFRSELIEKRGFPPTHEIGGRQWYLGVGLKETRDEEATEARGGDGGELAENDFDTPPSFDGSENATNCDLAEMAENDSVSPYVYAHTHHMKAFTNETPPNPTTPPNTEGGESETESNVSTDVLEVF